MRLLVGLGNPGAQYARHRHNIGFQIVDSMHAGYGFGPWRKRFEGYAASGALAGRKTLLLKPVTYMNESGRSVAAAMRYFKLAPSDISVFYDEIDLAPGKVRVKTGGGAGGHNGIRSIDAHIGRDYERVRIGVGHPGRKELVARYVLSDFAKADQAWLQPLIAALTQAAPLLLEADAAGFMNKLALLQKQSGAVPEAQKAEPDKISQGGKASRKKKDSLSAMGAALRGFFSRQGD